MFEFELHRVRSAELLRRAEHERLAREAVRVRHEARREATARRTAARPEPEPGGDAGHPRRRLPRAA
ncbi:hypothetical protein [Streptomyces sp. NPDC046805]|uniref:hypothetical protein n=1 Tax=Streptomyces sp. NPDC046805 TaxID=3155134 RepID=UPI0033E0DE1C